MFGAKVLFLLTFISLSISFANPFQSTLFNLNLWVVLCSKVRLELIFSEVGRWSLPLWSSSTCQFAIVAKFDETKVKSSVEEVVPEWKKYVWELSLRRIRSESSKIDTKLSLSLLLRAAPQYV